MPNAGLVENYLRCIIVVLRGTTEVVGRVHSLDVKLLLQFQPAEDRISHPAATFPLVSQSACVSVCQ